MRAGALRKLPRRDLGSIRKDHPRLGLIRRNIARVIEMAGSPQRLRPHVKTHKTREIARMLLDAGVTKHKCATIAEAENTVRDYLREECGIVPPTPTTTAAA